MHGLSLMFNWLTCADSFTPSNEDRYFPQRLLFDKKL